MRNPLSSLRRRRALNAAAAQPNAAARVPIFRRCVNTMRMIVPGERFVTIQRYPGIAVRYNPRRDPDFKSIVVRLLDQIAASATGATLLADIAAAAPASRVQPPIEGRAPQQPYPAGVQVIIRPPTTRDWRQVAIEGDPPQQVQVPRNINSGNFTAAEDQIEASLADGTGHNGGGSVATVQFNEQVAWTSQGEAVVPHIALAHELIHVRHNLYGEKKDGREEEYWTTGLYHYRDDPLTENRIRTEQGLPRRTRFYADDAPDE